MVVKEIIYKRLNENEIKSSFDGEYWPSQMWYCLRRQYYDRIFPSATTYDMTRFTVLGEALHNLIADMLKNEEGISVISEVPIRIPHPKNPEIVFSGRADDIIIVQFTKERYVIEVKSTEDLQSKVKKGFLPKKEHKAQLNLYLRAYPKSHGILLYVDRGNFDMEEIPIEFDVELYESTLQRAEDLHKYLTQRKTPPPEGKSAPDFNWQCNYCIHKARCDREQ